MTAPAATLARDLAVRGVRLEARGDRLRVEAPPGVLDDALRAALRARKAELLRLLAGEPRPPYDPLTDPRPALPEVRAVWALMEDVEAAGCVLVRSGPFASIQRRDGVLGEVPGELVDRLRRLSIGAVVRALTRRPGEIP